VALGRPAAALAQFDAATRLLGDTAEARLQSAEWRVLPRALGVVGISDAEVESGRRALESFVETPLAARALWVLALDALARHDSAAVRWREALVPLESGDRPFETVLAAVAAASEDPGEALRLSDPALAYDSAGRAPDPFFRAALHLTRGEWAAALGRSADADHAWLWYENTDAVGWPDAAAQAADVDWALGTYARSRRALLAASHGDFAVACAHARRVLEIWSRPEPAVAEVAEQLRRSASACRA
jgi:hypothetical protein